MREKPNSTHLTLWANRLIALVLAVLVFALPAILDWYCTVRDLSGNERTAITAAFYICAVIVIFALWLDSAEKRHHSPSPGATISFFAASFWIITVTLSNLPQPKRRSIAGVVTQ